MKLFPLMRIIVFMDELIIHYDGKCGLCLKSMQLFNALDHRKRLEFIDLNNVDTRLENVPPDSISFKVNKTIYTKSEALIKMTASLGLLGRFVYIFKIIPQSFRDWLYDRIAKHRNKVFRGTSRKNNCL